MPTESQSPQPPSSAGALAGVKPRWRAKDYFWFLFNNIIGWALILAAGPVGVLAPGPGGLPIFLIGFAMVTFPGKRSLTSRVLRGMPVNPDSKAYQWAVRIVAFLVPAGLISWVSWLIGHKSDRWYLLDRSMWNEIIWKHAPWQVLVLIIYCSLVVLIWIGAYRGVHAINLALAIVPRIRRKVRPWMRRRGMDLLPPRRRKRLTQVGHPADEGILEIDDRYQRKAARIWRRAKPWLKRIAAVVITVGIFYWMFKPVVQNWDKAREPLARMDWGMFVIAVLMFAAFLFIFRVTSWWAILSGMGHRLPLAPTARIWSTSELARYLPGTIWQVVGRVFLARPYGVPGAVCSASQIQELVLFLLANILLALGCLVFLGTKIDPQLKPMLFGLLALVPVLLMILHPPVFYGLLNRIMRRFGKPEITSRLKKRQLTGLGLWAILGLLWQSVAIFLIAKGPLELPWVKWWVVAGAYCVAWCAGFLAIWAPGGLGVREVVFMLVLDFALSAAVKNQMSDPLARKMFLAFLGVLLRLWATCGELVLTAVAHAVDYKGALGRPDAPGRLDDSSAQQAA